jgi:alkylhydroperoxidase/carboxymuconolactone decarboxylase family protein YurZ
VPTSASDAAGDLGAAIGAELGMEHPEATQRFLESDPELFRRYVDFRGWVLADGHIEKKTKLLMVVAVMCALKHPDAINRYASGAVVAGASREEVQEACRVGVLFSGGPGLIAIADGLYGDSYPRTNFGTEHGSDPDPAG